MLPQILIFSMLTIPAFERGCRWILISALYLVPLGTSFVSLGPRILHRQVPLVTRLI